jgi:CTP synthase
VAHTKYIVVVGGVISGVGKGITTASLGKILKEHGYKTTLIKIDPYINYDAGTLRPTEHGEVWVTEDGGEIDQDLGTYERFIDEDIPKHNNITTGQIYKAVIDRERRGEYLGKTVQFIPHIPEEILRRIRKAADGYEIAIIEIGGTVGDYENVPFLSAVKSLEREKGKESIVYVLVTYLPIPHHIREMKTKPAQQSIKLLNEAGIFPDFIICRAHHPLDAIRKKKIEVFANISGDAVISAPDIKTIYQIPLDLEKEDVGNKILKKLGVSSCKDPDWGDWKKRIAAITSPEQEIKIAVIGKYCVSGEYDVADSYVSIEHALIHAAAEFNCKVVISWVDSETFEQNQALVESLKQYQGVIVPGGFGLSGVEGKMKAIRYVREHDIPYLGLCYGLQLAVIEFARYVCGIKDAHTTEVDPETKNPVVAILEEQKEIVATRSYGGTMKLGAYPAHLKQGTKVYELYEKAGRLKEGIVFERHRHRYEVNPRYIEQLERSGMIFSGFYKRKDGTKLVEYIELSDHRFFIATQAHPEFKSRFTNPSPLFSGFIKASLRRKK